MTDISLATVGAATPGYSIVTALRCGKGSLAVNLPLVFRHLREHG